MVKDPLLGRQLGNYRLDRLLGRGGMASVYYATDVQLNRPAAVKIIDVRYRDQERFTNRFVLEARAVAAWRHPNIVQIYYADAEEDLQYFAMEYIEGTTLAQIIRERAREGQFLPYADVVRYGRAIASALDYAHARGVIHRDVKPLNVLVGLDGRVVLTDFGLALDTSQGSLGEVFGSPRYIAPEQARRSNEAVPASDLYSLGVVLYEMLTGVVPFDDPSPATVALQQITAEPPPPRKFNPLITDAAQAVILRALAKDPGDRFATGKDLMDALEAGLNVRPAVVATLPHRIVLPEEALEGGSAGTGGSGPGRPGSGGTSVGRRTHPTSASRSRPPAKPKRRRFPWLAWLAALLLISAAAVGLVYAQPDGPLAELLAVLAAPLTPSPTHTTAPTLTPLPTDTPTLTATRTPTHTPTEEPTGTTAPDAGLPSALPPSSTPSETPTETPAPSPTATPTEAPSPTPTLRYTDRRGFLLMYNATSFYMLQTSGVGDLITGLDFERVGPEGQPLNRFSAVRWTEYASSSKVNRCFQLFVNGAGSFLNPPDCADKALATLFLAPSNPELFWTPRPGSESFRVLWHEEELVRCQLAAGSCVVYLP